MNIQKEISRTIEGLYIILDYLDEQTTKQDKIKIVDFRHGCLAEISNNQKSKVPNLTELRAARGLDVSQFNINLSKNLKKTTCNPQTKKTEKEEDMPILKNIHIYFRKNGYYQAVYLKDGVRKCFTCKKRSEVIKRAKNFIESEKERFNGEDMTNFTAIANVWMETVKKPYISAVYYKNLRSIYTNHVENFLKNKKVRDITPIFLQSFFSNLVKESSRNAETVRTILTGVFEYAIGNGIITNNPMRAVVVERHQRQNGQALTRERLEKFKRDIAKHPIYCLPFLIFTYTGARVSEYTSLEFDFESGFVKIKNSKLKKWQTNYYREVPILKPLKDLKDEILKGTWRKVSLSELQKLFPKLVPGGRLNWLRHTFQTYCRLVASPEMVNLWAGHVLGNSTTDKVYLHIPKEDQLKIAEKINY